LKGVSPLARGQALYVRHLLLVKDGIPGRAASPAIRERSLTRLLSACRREPVFRLMPAPLDQPLGAPQPPSAQNDRRRFALKRREDGVAFRFPAKVVAAQTLSLFD